MSKLYIYLLDSVYCSQGLLQPNKANNIYVHHSDRLSHTCMHCMCNKCVTPWYKARRQKHTRSKIRSFVTATAACSVCFGSYTNCCFFFRIICQWYGVVRSVVACTHAHTQTKCAEKHTKSITSQAFYILTPIAGIARCSCTQAHIFKHETDQAALHSVYWASKYTKQTKQRSLLCMWSVLYITHVTLDEANRNAYTRRRYFFSFRSSQAETAACCRQRQTAVHTQRQRRRVLPDITETESLRRRNAVTLLECPFSF